MTVITKDPAFIPHPHTDTDTVLRTIQHGSTAFSTQKKKSLFAFPFFLPFKTSHPSIHKTCGARTREKICHFPEFSRPVSERASSATRLGEISPFWAQFFSTQNRPTLLAAIFFHKKTRPKFTSVSSRFCPLVELILKNQICQS
jgi:hypothetical protein